MNVRQEVIKEITDATKSAFCLKNELYTRKEWLQCIEHLIDRYKKQEVIEILFSKHMRWAYDCRNITPFDIEEFAEYIENNKEDIQEMLEG